MSNQPPSGSSSTTPKAISSLAKKTDVTRGGAQKLKFVPTLPVKKKKEAEVKAEPVSTSVTETTERGRGRGRGRGDSRGRGDGRGRGRGAARPPVELTASGPFAMGPSTAGTSSRRAAVATPVAIPTGANRASALGLGLSRTSAPTLKREPPDIKLPPGGLNQDEEVYSDPDEGVEIVDMDQVHNMDWLAPESLRKEKVGKTKKRKSVKEEGMQRAGKEKADAMDVDGTPPVTEVDNSNALNLSESEEEEEMEDLIEDFAREASIAEEHSDIQQERLYWFQFPSPFPTFVPQTKDAPPSALANVKKVAFAADTKPPAPSADSSRTPTAPPEENKDQTVDGVIGSLEIYQSGAVKMRLQNGIVLEVMGATQPSFLQQAVYLDMEKKQMCVLGEVNKRFVVSPELDTLLSALEEADRPVSNSILDGEDLIVMDDAM